MLSKRFEILLLLAVVMVFGAFSFLQTNKVSASENFNGDAPAEAPKFALLIGVNKYSYQKYPNKVRDLNGTNNDVGLMKNLLVDIYGFKYVADSETSPIKILLNEQATQKGIRDAFRSQIIENAKKYKETAKVDASNGATVVFYYSGHGSKLEDDNGDESDGIDETIMPHDTSIDRKNNKDIRDDEFDAFFTELKNYTTNITFIFDSCHSGTVTRGGNNKSVERDLDIKTNSRGGDAKVADGMTRGESYVAVSGSLPQQESQEDKFVDPDTKIEQWNGALTYSMVHLLRQNPDITYREMIKAVQNKVTAMQKNQTPQVEGDIDRKMFGTAQTRGKTPIFIGKSELVTREIDGAKTDLFEVSMDVGTIVGMGNGAAVAVFAKKDGAKVKEQIGSGVVVSSTEFDSKAEVVLDDKTIKKMPKDAVINLISPSFTSRSERLFALDYPPEQTGKSGTEAATTLTTKIFDYVRKNLDTKKVVKTVKETSIFKTVFGLKSASTPEWEYAVISGTFKDFKFSNPAANLLKASKSGENKKCAQTKPDSDDARGFFIVNRDGMPVYNLWFNETDESTGECLTEVITKIAKIENLRNLTSGESELNEQFKVEMVRLKKFDVVSRQPLKCEYESEEKPITQGETPQLKADDKYYLKVTNDSNQELFVYIYSLTTSGKIALLYPPEGAAGGEKLLPGKSFKTLDKLAPGGCGAFIIEPLAESPPGLETVKIIASVKEFPAGMLVQDSIASNSRGAGGINAIIEQAATGTRSGAMKFDVSDWTTKEINIDIVRK